VNETIKNDWKNALWEFERKNTQYFTVKDLFYTYTELLSNEKYVNGYFLFNTGKLHIYVFIVN